LETKEPSKVCEDAKQAIEEADIIILGPGDLYASTLANFAIGGVTDAVASSPGRLVYIVNLFTKAGETDGYSAKKHVEEVARYAGRKPDTILIHQGSFAEEVLDRYAAEKEFPVIDDLGEGAHILRRHFADVVISEKLPGDAVSRSLIRHDSAKIAEAIQALI